MDLTALLNQEDKYPADTFVSLSIEHLRNISNYIDLIKALGKIVSKPEEDRLNTMENINFHFNQIGNLSRALDFAFTRLIRSADLSDQSKVKEVEVEIQSERFSEEIVTEFFSEKIEHSHFFLN